MIYKFADMEITTFIFISLFQLFHRALLFCLSHTASFFSQKFANFSSFSIPLSFSVLFFSVCGVFFFFLGGGHSAYILSQAI